MLTTELSESSSPFRLEQHGDRWVTVCAECERVARVHMGAARPESAALALGASRRQHQSWCGSHEAEICTPEVAAEVADSLRRDAAAKSAGYAGANVYRGTCERCQTAVEAFSGGFLRAGRITKVFHIDTAFCAADVARLRELRSTRIHALELSDLPSRTEMLGLVRILRDAAAANPPRRPRPAIQSPTPPSLPASPPPDAAPSQVPSQADDSAARFAAMELD